MRSRCIAACVAVSAALSVVPVASAQEADAVDSPDTSVAELGADDLGTDAGEIDTEEPGAEESGAEDPVSDPDELGTTGAARVSVEVTVPATGAMQVVDVATLPDVSAQIPGKTPLRWSFEGQRPEGARALTADGRLYVAPGQAGTVQIPVRAVDTTTGNEVIVVEVTVIAGTPDAADNPDTKRQPTTARDVGIIVGSIFGVLGILAAMVQFLVPGGWNQVISFYS